MLVYTLGAVSNCAYPVRLETAFILESRSYPFVKIADRLFILVRRCLSANCAYPEARLETVTYRVHDMLVGAVSNCAYPVRLETAPTGS